MSFQMNAAKDALAFWTSVSRHRAAELLSSPHTFALLLGVAIVSVALAQEPGGQEKQQQQERPEP